MFIRITACWLADPLSGLLHQGLRTFHRFHARLGCYRLERKLPGGLIYSPTGVLRLSTAHSNSLLDSGERIRRDVGEIHRIATQTSSAIRDMPARGENRWRG